MPESEPQPVDAEPEEETGDSPPKTEGQDRGRGLQEMSADTAPSAGMVTSAASHGTSRSRLFAQTNPECSQAHPRIRFSGTAKLPLTVPPNAATNLAGHIF